MSDQPEFNAATRLLLRHIDGVRRQVTEDLDAIRSAMVIEFGEPTPPDDDAFDGKPGWVWRPVPHWWMQIHKNPRRPAERCVYIHTPGETFDSDVAPLSPAEARKLGRALLTAADFVDPNRTNDDWIDL